MSIAATKTNAGCKNEDKEVRYIFNHAYEKLVNICAQPATNNRDN